MRQQQTRLTIWIAVLVLALCVLFVAVPFSNEVQWNEAAAYSVLLISVGVAYEVWQWLKQRPKTYRLAFGVGLAGALLLFWVNGAVGIIGSEDNPANLLYGAVFAVGFFGAFIARFKPRGMSWTLFTAAAVQLLVPVFALLVWPAKVSWGAVGVIGVFALNTGFALLFVLSALMFQRARGTVSQLTTQKL